MAQDENDLGPDDEQGAPAEASAEEPVAAGTAAAAEVQLEAAPAEGEAAEAAPEALAEVQSVLPEEPVAPPPPPASLCRAPG